MLEEKIKSIVHSLTRGEIELEMIQENSDKFFEYYPEEHKAEFNTFHLTRFKKTIDKFGLDLFLEYIIKIELMKKEYGIFEAGLRMKKMKKYKGIALFLGRR